MMKQRESALARRARARACAAGAGRAPAHAAEALPKLGADLAQPQSRAYRRAPIWPGRSRWPIPRTSSAPASSPEGLMPAPRVPRAASSRSGRPRWRRTPRRRCISAWRRAWASPTRSDLADRAKELAEDGAIDPIAGLAADNVYLFSGNEDETVSSAGGARRRSASTRRSGVAGSQHHAGRGRGGHAFITEQGGAACGISEHALCQQLRLQPGQGHPRLDLRPARRGLEPSPPGKFIVFDQERLLASPGDGFADEGVVYVPHDCVRAAGCRVHIALHGCQQSRERGGRHLHQGLRLRRDRRQPTGSSSCSRKRRRARSTPMAAGTGGAIPGSTISARTRRRSNPSGPWSSSSRRRHELNGRS